MGIKTYRCTERTIHVMSYEELKNEWLTEPSKDAKGEISFSNYYITYGILIKDKERPLESWIKSVSDMNWNIYGNFVLAWYENEEEGYYRLFIQGDIDDISNVIRNIERAKPENTLSCYMKSR